MGSHDRTPTPQPAPAPASTRPLSTAGKLGVAFGALVCLGSALTGLNILVFGVGLLFLAAGFVSREPEPTKVCSACRSRIPAAASVCAHCRTEQPA